MMPRAKPQPTPAIEHDDDALDPSEAAMIDPRDAVSEALAAIPDDANAVYVIVNHRADPGKAWARVGQFPADWVAGEGPDQVARELGGGELRYDVRERGRKGAHTVQVERFASFAPNGSASSPQLDAILAKLEKGAGSGGGGDSTLLVAMMQAQSAQNVAMMQAQSQQTAAMVSAIASMGKTDVGGIVSGLAPLLPKQASRGIDEFKTMAELVRDLSGGGSDTAGMNWPELIAAGVKGLESVGSEARATRAERRAAALERHVRQLQTERNPNMAGNGPRTPSEGDRRPADPEHGQGPSESVAPTRRGEKSPFGGSLGVQGAGAGYSGDTGSSETDAALATLVAVLRAGYANENADAEAYALVALDVHPGVVELVTQLEPEAVADLVGARVVGGLEDGMRDWIADVAEAARDVVNEAVAAAKASGAIDDVERELIDDVERAQTDDDQADVAGRIEPGAQDDDANGGDGGPDRAA